ncbi:conjugal transfer protein MobB [Chryseobacterium chendengshani]|uniref:conjugal transfer protein MobB n=1 Tax=Chryseobacterium sp. LJ756 TaxID=2864113 RepID=UPI001C6443DE|nr:conjugal transfer protein MobB [Chryseobacterium sp. LJ756]MBW7674242.1 relaxase/mobilization nuclease domain-containing protein [Chryseobacterium sp. LJ756]
MIAKIGRSSNLFGTLSYNNLKIEQKKGKILLMNNMIETCDGKYSVSQLAKSFEPYLLANRNTEKHTLHISLNPDPKDKVYDEQYKEMAQLYMNKMGYGDQPFVVFKHTDIDRSHIHIVSVCVDEEGKKISDQFEKVRSMKVCRELEKKFSLIAALERQPVKNQKVFKPVNFMAGNIKSQMASVIRHLPYYYQFQSLGEYNALLSLFNITAEKIEGELPGKQWQGLLYFPLDEKDERAGHSLKASLFGKNAGFQALEQHFSECKTAMKDSPLKITLKSAINLALQTTTDEQSFRGKLMEQGIDIMVRRAEAGRIYGITFIDHRSKTVWNGSRLGKELSANSFNDYWNKSNKPEMIHSVKQLSKTSRTNDADLPGQEPHYMFDLLNSPERQVDGLIEALGGLLPETQGEDYEEKDFANKMKKKRRRN